MGPIVVDETGRTQIQRDGSTDAISRFDDANFPAVGVGGFHLR